jgi:hypothetical protein
MVNLSALNNIPPFVLNSTILDDSATELIPNLQEIANSASDGYFTIGVLVIFFLYLVITLNKKDATLRLPIQKTLQLSSGFTVILGILMLVLNFSGDVQPTIWFLMLFLISSVIIYILKTRGE